MLKSVIKFSLLGLGIAVLGVGALYGIDWLRYRKSPEYRAYQEVERIKKEIADDPYGGDTAEETLRLFIDALKAGDTDLAAKYFVYEKQDEWKVDLAQIKDKGLLQFMLQDLERAEISKKEQGITFFVVTNENNEVTTQIIMKPTHISKKWKITEL